MEGDERKTGVLQLTLEEYLQEHGISKNKISKLAKLQRTQLNLYCKNRIQRLDLAVLARICGALDCEVSDILKYKKDSEGE